MTTIPFTDSALATSDAAGNITFGGPAGGFQQPRMLEWRQGSFSVVRSDGSTVIPSSVLPITWKAFVGATIWGTWYNDQPSLMVQTNGPQLKVTGTNLAASTAYQCIFTGYDSDNPPALSPLPAPAPPPSGFTSLVSGLNNGTAITANPQYLNASGAPVASPVWFPVVVGTALEIAYMQAVATNVRITPLWSTTGTGTGVIVHNADTFDLSFVSPNNVMQGLTYLNHGPYVAFLIQGVGATPSVVINTGLPPIVRSPSVSQGILAFSGGPFVSGITPFALSPYTGQAMLSGECVGAAQKFEMYITAADYLGNSFRSSFVVDSMADPNGVRVIPPTRFFIPPLICTLNVLNGNGISEGGDFQLVALGP